MCDAARIIAIRLVAHGAKTGLHMPTFKTKRWIAGCSQLGEQPRRRRASFQTDALQRTTELLQERNDLLRLGSNLLFQEDGSVPIDDAHVDGFERYIEACKVVHGLLRDGTVEPRLQSMIRGEKEQQASREGDSFPPRGSRG